MAQLKHRVKAEEAKQGLLAGGGHCMLSVLGVMSTVYLTYTVQSACRLALCHHLRTASNAPCSSLMYIDTSWVV